MVNLTLTEISKYLTELVLEQAFKVKTQSQDNVQSVEISRAAPAGSGLLGAVYRIQVKGFTHKAYFVAKAMIPDPILQKSLQTAKYFKREITFFSQVLPALTEFQKSSGAQERIQSNVPICYAYHCDGENDFILMEDLRESGCVLLSGHPSKHERDDILKTLAHLHAVSMALRTKRPEHFKKIIDTIPEQYYSESNRSRYSPFLQNAIDIDLLALAEFEDPETSVYYKKLQDLVTNDPYGQLIRLTSSPSDHPTITHGDAWIPNFLCSKNKAVVIDFQLLRCTSPATDLSFLIILTSSQTRNTEYALDGLRVYYKALKYYLKDMGVPAEEVLSWQNLNDHLKKYGRFGMLAAVSTIPLLISDRFDVLQDFEKKNDGVEKIPLEKLWQLRPYETEDEKQMWLNAVKIAVDLGFI